MLLAGIAAWFSVSGIAQLFAGAGISVIIMAFAIELSKLVGVSFLYRFRKRKEVPGILKVYLWAGIFTIMLITSAGVYAYLSQAYSGMSVGIKQVQSNLDKLDQQYTIADTDAGNISNRISQIEKFRKQQEDRLDEMLRVGRNTNIQQGIIRQQDQQLALLISELAIRSRVKDSLLMEKSRISDSSITTNGKLVTFSYISNIIGIPLDNLVKWFIFVLVIVLDPMSISLFIAYNVVVMSKEKEKIQLKKNAFAADDIEDNQIKSYSEESLKLDDMGDEGDASVPYYMKADYDWDTDTRWHNDMTARGFRNNMGQKHSHTQPHQKN